MSATSGIGELSVLLPALSRLARAGRYIAWIAPPYLPHAPALVQRGLPLERVLIIRSCTLQESLWAAEQALLCPAFGAVLSWPARVSDKNVRRLQLAAETGGSLGILYRPAAAASEPSPAALRSVSYTHLYGFLLPMDESEAQVTLDLSGRPYFVFDGQFGRDQVGALPSELVPHFFRSLSQALGAALHISVRGENTHHMIEACFKGVGRALRPALRREGYDLPSTKGAL